MSDPKHGKLPRASSITQHHLEQAYVLNSSRQRKRIEEWGKMNRKVLKNIGKHSSRDGTTHVKPEEKKKIKPFDKLFTVSGNKS